MLDGTNYLKSRAGLYPSVVMAHAILESDFEVSPNRFKLKNSSTT